MFIHQVAKQGLVQLVGGELGGSVRKDPNHLSAIALVQCPKILKFYNLL